MTPVAVLAVPLADRKGVLGGRIILLLVAATEMEMAPLRDRLAGRPGCDTLVTGVGVLEAALALSRYLAAAPEVTAVVNFGVAGAYEGAGAAVLDLCLAEEEVMADLGICLADGIAPFAPDRLTVPTRFPLDSGLRQQAAGLLREAGMSCRSGTFLTVCAASGTAARGRQLCRQHGGLCENMEGAAAARVCQEFGVGCLELRAMSNMVQDRDPASWRLAESCERCAAAVAVLVDGLAGRALPEPGR